ncbi:MAG: serpin family protein [Actinomycetota bacterium]|nr:serpin family protein [Actinomycetota bacterium]
MKKRFAALAVAGAMTAALSLAGCGAQPPEELRAADVQRVQVNASDYAVQVRQLSDAALNLGAKLVAAGGDGNVVTSPASLLVALAMLRVGASGATAAELDTVIGFPAAGRDEAMNAILAALSTYDGDPATVNEKEPPAKPVLHLADGLFVDRSQPPGKDYLRTLAAQYGAGVFPVDFLDKAATKPRIDAWVSRNTGGRIKEAPAEYRPDNTFSLLNSAFFAAAWQTPFSADSTHNAGFTTVRGDKIQVPMMNGVISAKYATGPDWQAIDIPYRDGFVMRLVLPAPGSAPSPAPARAREVAAALDAAQPAAVELSLPKWDHKSTADLEPVLKAMGLTVTLGPDADFHLIQDTMTITAAAQAANITVAEKGTVAAAVSQLNGMAVSGRTAVAPLKLSVDRPFSYQILQLDGALPLFMGQVTDPR